MNSPAITTGMILKERFQLLEKLGEGGFAAVYRATDLKLNREVAVKVLKLKGQSGASLMDDELVRFQREAKLLAQLSHPNIVGVYSIDALNDAVPFIVMEYIQGQSLQSFINDKGALSYEQCRSVFSDVCEALSYAHKLGIVHRDLSALNILLQTEDGKLRARLIDFGISKLLFSSAELTQATRTGELIGNPSYMSPELCRGGAVDQRSDIYSFGCILYQAIGGKLHFEAFNAIGLLHLHQNEYPSPPQFSWDNPVLVERYKYISLRCMQKKAELRFQSMDEIASLLSESADGKSAGSNKTFPVLALNKLDNWELGDTKKRRRTLSAKGILTVCAGGGVIVLMLSIAMTQAPVLLLTLLRQMHNPLFIPLEETLAFSQLKRSPSEAKVSFRNLLNYESTKNNCSKVYSYSLALFKAEVRKDKDLTAAFVPLEEAMKCRSAPKSDEESFLLSAFKCLEESSRTVLNSKSQNSFSRLRIVEKCTILQSQILGRLVTLARASTPEFRQGLSAFLGNLAAWTNLNGVYSPSSKPGVELVVVELTRILQVKPKLAQPQEWLLNAFANIAFENADPDLSLKLAELTRVRLSILPSTSNLRSQLNENLVSFLMAAGKRSEAMRIGQKYLQPGFSLDLNDRVRLLFDLSQIAHDQGDDKQALKFLNMIDESSLLDRNRLEVRKSRISFYNSMGMKKESRIECEKAFSLLPNPSQMNQLVSSGHGSLVERMTLKTAGVEGKETILLAEDHKVHVVFYLASQIFIAERQDDLARASLRRYLDMIRNYGLEPVDSMKRAIVVHGYNATNCDGQCLELLKQIAAHKGKALQY